MDKCRFCDPVYQKERNDLENEHFFANFDKHPVSKGHMKLIPKRHVDSFFDLTHEEVKALYDLLKKAKKMLDEKFHPDGYSIGINEGKAAGQTKFHLHVHLIPRYFGDVPDPTGGVRNVIPEKGNYLKKSKA
ncbi:MAG: HIT family protein [Candidatus Aenigmarchaeota archaeon]